MVLVLTIDHCALVMVLVLIIDHCTLVMVLVLTIDHCTLAMVLVLLQEAAVLEQRDSQTPYTHVPQQLATSSSSL